MKTQKEQKEIIYNIIYAYLEQIKPYTTIYSCDMLCNTAEENATTALLLDILTSEEYHEIMAKIRKYRFNIYEGYDNE